MIKIKTMNEHSGSNKTGKRNDNVRTVGGFTTTEDNNLSVDLSACDEEAA